MESYNNTTLVGNLTNPNNLTRTSNFKVFLPLLDSEIMYAQGVTLPGFSLNPVPAYNSGLALKAEGDFAQIDPITISLVVDENYALVKRIYSTFKDLVHPDNGTFAPNTNFECAIEITNNSGIAVFAMELHQCAMQSISPITLLANSEDDIIVVDLTIEPSYYSLIDKLSDSALVQQIIKQ